MNILIRRQEVPTVCELKECGKDAWTEILIADGDWIGLCPEHIEEIVHSLTPEDIRRLAFTGFVASGALELEQRIAEMAERQTAMEQGLAETQRLIDQLATNKTTIKELLQRAYMLLGDISHPFRNVERYDVQKWLDDAKPFVDKVRD